MRDIKFRAWDKTNNRFTGRFCIGDDGSFIDMTSGDNSEWRVVKDMTINGYTGVKDSNGAEIYEGDIVRWQSERLEVIEFPFIDEDIQITEVIGNIHENPELLNEKNT